MYDFRPMRHEYVGDIGDFGKFALLKALAGSDLTLGIVWYLNTAPEATNDGSFTRYDHLRSCDPELHDKLLSIVQSGTRRLDVIQSCGILPFSTVYYSKS